MVKSSRLAFFLYKLMKNTGTRLCRDLVPALHSIPWLSTAPGQTIFKKCLFLPRGYGTLQETESLVLGLT